jgi:phosphoribosylaminoimidazole carboxylase (NCAIR synthetase)
MAVGFSVLCLVQKQRKNNCLAQQLNKSWKKASDDILSKVEGSACKSFKIVTINFENMKAENCESLAEKRLNAYNVTWCKI